MGDFLERLHKHAPLFSEAARGDVGSRAPRHLVEAARGEIATSSAGRARPRTALPPRQSAAEQQLMFLSRDKNLIALLPLPIGRRTMTAARMRTSEEELTVSALPSGRSSPGRSSRKR
jgi:hypothetical protein